MLSSAIINLFIVYLKFLEFPQGVEFNKNIPETGLDINALRVD